MPDRGHETIQGLTPERAEILVFCLHNYMLESVGEARALPAYAVGPANQSLAMLFRESGIRNISLEPVQAARTLVAGWLATGAFDPAKADSLHAAAGAVYNGLAPVMQRAIAHGLLNKDLSNVPNSVTSVRSAYLIAEMMLGWHETGKLNDPAWREMLAAKTKLFAELQPEMNEFEATAQDIPPADEQRPVHRSCRQCRFH